MTRSDVESNERLFRVLTMLLLWYTSLVGSTKYDYISVEKVCEEIEQKNIFHYIYNETKDDLDIMKPVTYDELYKDYIDYYHEEMWNQLNVVTSSETGAKNSGLCLLIYFTGLLIHHGSGWRPQNDMKTVLGI